jgi:hypothetical protein
LGEAVQPRRGALPKRKQSTTPEAALWQGLHATPSNPAAEDVSGRSALRDLKALFGTVTPRLENRMVGNANASKERKAAGR